MAVDETVIQARLKEIERHLAELKEEEKILLSLKEDYERWLAIKRHSRQPHLEGSNRKREADGTLISVAVEVLKEAYPEGLHATEIWERLQARGVKSQAKRPAAALAFSLHSFEKRTGLVERVGPNIWRWAGKQDGTAEEGNEETSEGGNTS